MGSKGTGDARGDVNSAHITVLNTDTKTKPVFEGLRHGVLNQILKPG